MASPKSQPSTGNEFKLSASAEEFIPGQGSPNSAEEQRSPGFTFNANAPVFSPSPQQAQPAYMPGMPGYVICSPQMPAFVPVQGYAVMSAGGTPTGSPSMRE